jgi:hypothetical protein
LNDIKFIKNGENQNNTHNTVDIKLAQRKLAPSSGDPLRARGSGRSQEISIWEHQETPE